MDKFLFIPTRILLKHLVPAFILRQFHDDRLQGTLQAGTMFVDLSGFTPLTESLMKDGSAGAEKLSDILNNIFGPMVELVHQQGGFIPYFAGDAFTAIFPEQDEENVNRLLHAACDIRNLFIKNNFELDEFKFGIKIGLSYGQVEWGIIGKEQKSYYFRGPGVEAAAESQIRASHQEIVLDQQLQNILPPHVHTSTLNKAGYFLLTDNKAPRPTNHTIPELSLDIQELSSQFLPDDVIQFIGKGEFRSVISVFCSFDGVDNHDALNEFASIFIREIYRFAGYFKEVDFGDKGGVLVAIFGAPVSFENNIERALEFADTLKSLLATFDGLKYRMGITSGQAFTGMVGGQHMSQFAAVGNRVNLAARLMTYANWNEIYVDEEIAQHTGFQFKNKGQIRYKGIEGLIKTYELKAKSEKSDHIVFSGKLISREKELINLIAFVRKHQLAQRSGICFLTGEAGIGKSRLAYELQKALDNNLNWIHTEADQILQNPLNPFVKYLRKFFQARANQSEEKTLAKFESNFEKLLEQTRSYWPETEQEVKRLYSTYKAILNLKVDANSIYKRLDAKEKYTASIRALSVFFQIQARIKPTVILVDDAHWLDQRSKAFIVELLNSFQNRSLIILFALRADGISKPKEFLNLDQIPRPVSVLHIPLEPLSNSGTKAFCKALLGAELSEESLQNLQNTSNGNPFYIEQLIDYFKSNQLLSFQDNNWVVQDADIKLNNNINALLVAKVDNLSSPARELLKVAAVIGREFEVSVLEDILKQKSIFEQQEAYDQRKASLKEAENNNILRPLSKGRYGFKHSMQHEVIYDMQLHTRLKTLHQATADAIENIFSTNLRQRFVDLVFHYEKAENTPKTKEYLLKAGDYFKGNFQNDQANIYYQKLLELVKNSEDFAVHFKVLIRIGDILQVTGKWDEANETYSEALYLSNKLNSKTLMGRANNAIGYLHLLLGNYKDAGHYFDKAIELFSVINDKVGASKVSGNLGLLYFRKAEYQEAEIHFINSLERSKEVGYRDKNAQIVANLALTYMNLGDYDRGIKYLDEEIVECTAAGDKTGIANLSINKGILLTEKGENERAQESLEKGIKLAEELDNKRLTAIATGSLGSLHEQKGYYRMAMDFYQKDLQLTKELGDKQGISIALNLIGDLQSKMGEFDEAIETLEQAIHLSDKLDYKKGKAKAVNTLGDVYFFLKDYKQSLKYYNQAIELTRITQNQLVLGQSLYEKSLVLIALEKYDEIMPVLEEATSIAYKLGNKQLLFQLSIAKADYLIAIEEFEDAKRVIKQLEEEELTAENKGLVLCVKYQLTGADEFRAEALTILNTLYKATPDYSIKMRIDSLKTKAIS